MPLFPRAKGQSLAPSLDYSPRKKAYIFVYYLSGQIFESQDVCFDEGSEVEHTRVVIDPSFSDEPAPEDEIQPLR